MKTIVAVFSEATPAYQVAQALHKVGLDPHYMKVITRESEGEAVVATVGKVDPGRPDGRTAVAPTTVEGQALRDMLRFAYGADTAVDWIEQVRDEHRSFLVVQTPEYLVEEAVATVRHHQPDNLDLKDLAWDQFSHPGEPSSFAPPPTPKTADFYGPESDSGPAHEVQPELEYADRRSLFYDHYRRHYAASGRPFSHFAAAYQFGYEAADNEAWRQSDWEAVKTAVKAQWMQEQPSPWADLEAAILHGWVVQRNQA